MINFKMFRTAASMFISQLVYSENQYYHYYFQPKLNWEALFSMVESFIYHAFPIYENLNALDEDKPKIFDDAYTHFSKLTENHENLKFRYVIEKRKKTLDKDQSKKEKPNNWCKKDEEYNIYNQFLIYFINTPDPQLWADKDYYNNLNKLSFECNSAIQEYNFIMHELQELPALQKTFFCNASSPATAQPQETKSTQQQCSQDVQQQLSHYESSCL